MERQYFDNIVMFFFTLLVFKFPKIKTTKQNYTWVAGLTVTTTLLLGFIIGKMGLEATAVLLNYGKKYVIPLALVYALSSAVIMFMNVKVENKTSDNKGKLIN